MFANQMLALHNLVLEIIIFFRFFNNLFWWRNHFSQHSKLWLLSEIQQHVDRSVFNVIWSIQFLTVRIKVSVYHKQSELETNSKN